MPEGGFDTARMARGEPGIPRRFRGKSGVYEIAALVESGKAYGDCRHGSGERYVRRHIYRLRTTDGRVIQVCFLRSLGKPARNAARWWLQAVEEA